MTALVERAATAVDPVTLAADLIRFDTTNPPGAEAACVAYVRDVLTRAGVATSVVARDPRRPNLVARFAGRGAAPGLLLHAHVDVVPVTGQAWTHPPFDGAIVDGELYGRGAIDMKGGLAMMLAALLDMRARGEQPAGDVVLAVVSDEEAGSRYGAHVLADEHAGLLAGVRYAIGEDGGAALSLDGAKRVHPIVVAEKRACWLRLTVRGPHGHGSRVPTADAAVRKLTRLLVALSAGGLEPRITPAVDEMLVAAAAAAPEPMADALLAFRADPSDERQLSALPPEDAQYLASVVRHTANPTVIHGGHATNVVPGEITVEIDGRLLPGTDTDEFVTALRATTGVDFDVDVLVEGEPLPEPELGPFYRRLAQVLGDNDPGGVVLPMTTTASTDARLFPKLGISCYGWIPLLLPPGAPHRRLLHAPDERVPVDALRFGTACFTDLLRRYP